MRPEEYDLVLLVPVPRELEGAVAYDRDARFPALGWEPSGDEVMRDDGRVTATGDWRGFLVYIHHPRVAPHLEPYDLGSSKGPGTYCLLIDRVERRAYVGTLGQAARSLTEATPWPVLREGVSGEDLMEALKQAPSSFRLPSPEELEKEMREREEATNALAQALDRAEGQGPRPS